MEALVNEILELEKKRLFQLSEFELALILQNLKNQNDILPDMIFPKQVENETHLDLLSLSNENNLTTHSIGKDIREDIATSTNSSDTQNQPLSTKSMYALPIANSNMKIKKYTGSYVASTFPLQLNYSDNDESSLSTSSSAKDSARRMSDNEYVRSKNANNQSQYLKRPSLPLNGSNNLDLNLHFPLQSQAQRLSFKLTEELTKSLSQTQPQPDSTINFFTSSSTDSPLKQDIYDINSQQKDSILMDKPNVTSALEFCIIEANWDNLKTDQMKSFSPLLPPCQKFRYPDIKSGDSDMQDQTFFFPSGVKVDYVSPALVKLLTRNANHKRHIVQFINQIGLPSYACCLTITKSYSVTEINTIGKNIISNLVLLNKMKHAAQCIQKCFRQFANYKKDKDWQLAASLVFDKQQGSATDSTHGEYAKRKSGKMVTSPSIKINATQTATTTSQSSSVALNNGNNSDASSVEPRKGFFSKMFGSSVKPRPNNTASLPPPIPTSNTDINNNINNNNNNNNIKNPMDVKQGLSLDLQNPEKNGSDARHSIAFSAMTPGGEEFNNLPSSAYPFPSPMKPSSDINSTLNIIIDEDDLKNISPANTKSPVQPNEMNIGVSLTNDDQSVNNINNNEDTPIKIIENELQQNYLNNRIVIAQKAFCIISPIPEYTFIFKVLDAIAEAEKVSQERVESLQNTITSTPLEDYQSTLNKIMKKQTINLAKENDSIGSDSDTLPLFIDLKPVNDSSINNNLDYVTENIIPAITTLTSNDMMSEPPPVEYDNENQTNQSTMFTQSSLTDSSNNENQQEIEKIKIISEFNESLCLYRQRFLDQIQLILIDNYNKSAYNLQDLSINFTIPSSKDAESNNRVLQRYMNLSFDQDQRANNKNGQSGSGSEPNKRNLFNSRSNLYHYQRQNMYFSGASGGIADISMHADTSDDDNVKSNNKTKKGIEIKNKREICNISIKNYVDPFILDMRTLLTTKEWSCSVMFAHLNSQIIFKIINLLLMEKSLIIYGKNAGIVTSITLAVTTLISPFVWEGIFVPLVPDNARELFGAPVPLIAGTTSPPRIDDVSNSTAILYLNDDVVVQTEVKATSPLTKKYRSLSRKNNNLSNNNNSKGNNQMNNKNNQIEFIAWFVRLPEVNADMPVDSEICKRIDYVRRLICSHYSSEIYQPPRSSPLSRNSSLLLKASQVGLDGEVSNTLDSLLMSDVPETIVKQVQVLVTAIKRYNFKFCGSLSSDPTSWKKFLRYNTTTGEEEFYPAYFMEPLRNYLEFQDAMVHTQMFVAFMEKLRSEHKLLENIRIFISHWIYFRIVLIKKKRKKEKKKFGFPLTNHIVISSN
eukprot:gene4365-6176_t